MKFNNFSLVVVENSSLIVDFLKLPSAIYHNQKSWIRPLDDEIEKIFDKSKNKLYKTGDAIRWLLYNSDGNVIGRMAAFYDKRTAAKNDQLTGGIGFFVCVDDKEAAHTLFDAGKEWLQQKGMEAMDGPVNFGDRNSFWGCLVDGFSEPVFNMPYNPSYYQELFESYGFKNYFNQYTYSIDVQTGVQSPVLRLKGERLLKNQDYHFEIFERKNRERIAEDFKTIYNKAWARFPGVSKMRLQHVNALFNSIKAIMDKRAFVLGYYKDEPIAFYIMVPDINQLIYDFDGKMNLLNKIKLLYRLKVLNKCTRLIGLIFGVTPEYQGKGVESAILLRFEKEIAKAKFTYTDLEMNWIGDFNPVMMKFVEQIGGKIHKTHVTYRYLFDRSKEFTRADLSF